MLFTDSTKMMDLLDTIFGDSNQLQMAKAKFCQLYQWTTPFAEFLSEFIHWAMEAKEPESQWKEELYYCMSYNIQDQLMSQSMDPMTTFSMFHQHCGQVATHITQ